MFTSLSASIDILSTGVIITDTSHNVTLMNQSAKRLLHATHITKTLEEVVTKLPERLEFLVHVKYCSLEHKSCSFREVEIEDHVVALTLYPIFEGPDLMGNLITLDDITERVSKDRTRDQFLSLMVHELRTPITAIKGNASLISDFYPDALKDQQLKELVTDIQSGSANLLEMVNQFLDMSRLEEGRIHYDLQEFNVGDTIATTVAGLHVLADQKHLSLDAPQATSDLVALGDPTRTRQVLTNLIGNAIKFTEAGRITVAIDHTPTEITVSVSDTGPGIPADSKAGLFKKYFQASNNQFKHDASKSTGLGLYVTRLIMEGMRGSISHNDTQGHSGSVFTVTLPKRTPTNLKLMQKAIAEDRQGARHAQAPEHTLVG